MSFAREALSIAVLEALCPTIPQAGGGLWRSTAGDRVYLERIGALDDLANEEPYPTIVIYTERDVGVAGDGAGPPFRRQIDLVIDLTVLLLSTPLDEDGEMSGPPVLTVPATDREMSAALNVLEGQVRAALYVLPGGRHYRRLVSKTATITSEPDRGGEEGIKFAARRLTLSVQVPDDCFPAAPRAPAEGLARLPQPLRSIVEDLVGSGHGGAHLATLADAMAQGAPVATLLVPLTGMSLAIDVSRPGDGSADISADIALPQD